MKTLKPLPNVTSGGAGRQKNGADRGVLNSVAGASADRQEEIPAEATAHNLSSGKPRPVDAGRLGQRTEPATSASGPGHPAIQYSHQLDAVVQAQGELMEVIA